MRVSYAREQYTGLAIGGSVGGVIFVLLIYSFIIQGITKENIIGSGGALIAMALFLGAGIYSAKKAHQYRTERKKLVSESCCCDGEVIAFENIRLSDKKSTCMKVRYFSKLLNKEVVFNTPVISMSIKKEPGIKCTVYEAHDNEPEPVNRSTGILNLKDAEGSRLNLDTYESVGVVRIVDTLDKSTVKSTKVADTLFLIVVIILFIIAGYFCVKQ